MNNRNCLLNLSELYPISLHTIKWRKIEFKKLEFKSQISNLMMKLKNFNELKSVKA